MQIRRTLTIFTAALLAAACSDTTMPTEVPTESAAFAPEDAQFARHGNARNGLLSDIPVTEQLAGGNLLNGTLTINELSFANGQLLASGTLEGTVTDATGEVTEIAQDFTDVAADLTADGNGASCRILELDLGPLDLDLLGLVVDLSAIELDVTAERGPGNLLGNLLCSVAGLLDGGIEGILDQVNDLLGADGGLLNDIPVVDDLGDGNLLEGLLTITDLGLMDGQLVASGTLTGTVTDAAGEVTEFTQEFTDVAMDLANGGNGASCRILELDLGPLNLDLLGLVVDLSAIELDITAERGPGNLLGNLLCGVAGLLDPDGGLLDAVDRLLNRVNDLL